MTTRGCRLLTLLSAGTMMDKIVGQQTLPLPVDGHLSGRFVVVVEEPLLACALD
jgi:hypothetical protein